MHSNIYFSPTGNTQKLTTYVSQQLGQYEDVDLSVDHQDLTIKMKQKDICIIGVPSFGGRVPQIAIERLNMIKGDHTPVIMIASYGNRAYEDTLIELKTNLNQNGFICIAAMAIVCEHSIMHQFGKGRPDATDYHEIDLFIHTIKERLKSPYREISVSGNIPYREYHVSTMVPFATKKCTECGLCGKLCPVGAISLEHPRETNSDICISCMRCVSMCPRQARECDASIIEALVEKLKKACAVAKPNDFF